MKTPDRVQSAGGIVVFHSGDSLMRQLDVWSDRCPGCDLRFSSAESSLEICNASRRGTFVLIDAVEDPKRARLGMLWVTAVREAPVVAVYTEAADEGLELFVRTRGGLLLLGPMSNASWDGVFGGVLQSSTRKPRCGLVKQLRVGREAERVAAGVSEPSSGKQCSAGSCRLK